MQWHPFQSATAIGLTTGDQRRTVNGCPKIDPNPYGNQLPKSPGTGTFALWKSFPLGLVVGQ